MGRGCPGHGRSEKVDSTGEEWQPTCCCHHCSPWCLGLWFIVRVTWSSSLRIQMIHTLIFPGSLLCRWQMIRLVGLHSCGILIINAITYVYPCHWLLFLENSEIHTRLTLFIFWFYFSKWIHAKEHSKRISNISLSMGNVWCWRLSSKVISTSSTMLWLWDHHGRTHFTRGYAESAASITFGPTSVSSVGTHRSTGVFLQELGSVSEGRTVFPLFPGLQKKGSC